MDLIINNDEYKIIYETNKLVYKIEFFYPNPILINSILIPKLLPGATRDEEFKFIKFKANSVKSLIQFQKENKNQKINTTALLINSLSKQLNYLITEENYSFLGYSLDNTIVINDQRFIYLGVDLLKNIDEKEDILICKPFSKNDFFISPELEKIKSLPTYIPYKTVYFSLGCLALCILLEKNNDFYNEYLQKEKNLISLLEFHPSKNTKIYWRIIR
jgi:hypothetical protein